MLTSQPSYMFSCNSIQLQNINDMKYGSEIQNWVKSRIKYREHNLNIVITFYKHIFNIKIKDMKFILTQELSISKK